MTPISSAALVAVLFAAMPAHAQEFRLHVEPAVALWVDQPQSDRFTPGFYGAIRPGLSLGRVVDLQWSYAILYTPSASGFTGNGTAHFITAGVRVRPLAFARPKSEQLGGLFIDFDAGYVRSESFDRFGIDFGLGYGFQISPSFSLGIVARYTQIFQPDDTPQQDPNDGQLMSFGLDLGFGPAYEEATAAEDKVCPYCAECAQCSEPAKEKVCPIAEACPDRDHDGVCDAVDRCPDAIGPPAALGCPLNPCTGPPLIVLVQFRYDSAQLPSPNDNDPQSMDPVLDAVAAAIAQDPSCRVCIVGYASEEGGADYNQELSSRRSGAVKGYLHARGLESRRIPSTGLGERCQLVPTESLELNRRVEFRRLQEGASCPTDCSR